ncbi:hypothetical protein RB594_003106 [Gaeumannomyces avenae]
MVYCGKASQGCQNCRTRRIKCDKLKPECSQCVRVGKKCPGYRDQLSLVFRDESSKVMQKAHAQWGVEAAESSGSSSSSDSPSPPSSNSSVALSPASVRSQPSPPARSARAAAAAARRTTSPVAAAPSPTAHHLEPSWQDKGIKFFVDHFVIGLPDEAIDAQSLSHENWVFDRSMQNTMAAVGLAGMGNLRNDKQLISNAHSMYGAALRDTGRALAAGSGVSHTFMIRSVLMLAMFEIVNGTDPRASSGAQTHIIGAASLLRSFIPIQSTGTMGTRGLLQLCLSLLLACVVDCTSLPGPFSDWVTVSCRTVPDEEWPATELVLMMVRLVNLTSGLRMSGVADGDEAAAVLEQLLSLEDQMASWEARIGGKWAFSTLHGDFPPQACFQGQYHVYTDNWTARVWNFYRWARLMVCSALLDLLAGMPPGATAAHRAAREPALRAMSLRLARDTLVSVPTHWKHPSMDAAQRARVRCAGGAGTGAVGVPGLLFHVDVAASARGVPREWADWALGLLDSVWADMGMVHARRISDGLRDRLDRRADGRPGARPPPAGVEIVVRPLVKIESEG